MAKRSLVDPDILRATKKRKSRKVAATPDLHDEWAMLKRLPARGFFLDYERIDCLALIQYIILAKSRHHYHGLSYRVKFDKVLYCTPHFNNRDKWTGQGQYYERDPDDPQGAGQLWIPAHRMMFTRKQIEQAIAAAKANHRQHFSYELKRTSEHFQEMSRRIQYMSQALSDLDRSGLPPEVLAKIPEVKP